MEKFIDLILKLLPAQAEKIKLLQHVPAAVDTVKELTALVQRSLEILKQEKLTDAQKAERDRFLAEDWKTLPHWQEEPGS